MTFAILEDDRMKMKPIEPQEIHSH